jgi:hypothetical protein
VAVAIYRIEFLFEINVESIRFSVQSQLKMKAQRNIVSIRQASISSRKNEPLNSSLAVIENAAKCIPNSNSKTNLVAVPTPKLTAKMWVQN